MKPEVTQNKIETHYPVLFMERSFESYTSLNTQLGLLVRELESTKSSYRPNNQSQYNAGFSTEINLSELNNPAISILHSMIEDAFIDYLKSLNNAGLLNTLIMNWKILTVLN